MKKLLGIVTARGGSKRIVGKNKRILAGQPLIYWTFESMIESGAVDRILFSSDDDEILALARDYGSNRIEIMKRDAGLAQDTSTALQVVCDIFDHYERMKEFDAIGLFLPTCPFRRSEHIRAGVSLLNDDVDGVVSTTQYDFPPQLALKFDRGSNVIEPLFDPSPLITGNTRSQDQAPILRPNGAFYLAHVDSFARNRNFFKGRVKTVVMDRKYSVDLDTEDDLAYAEFMANKLGIAK